MELLNFPNVVSYLKDLDMGEQHLDLLDFLNTVSPAGLEMMSSFLAVLLNDIPDYNWDFIRKHSAFNNLSNYLENVKAERLKENVILIVNSFLNLYSLAEAKTTFKWGAYIYIYLKKVRDLYNDANDTCHGKNAL